METPLLRLFLFACIVLGAATGARANEANQELLNLTYEKNQRTDWAIIRDLALKASPVDVTMDDLAQRVRVLENLQKTRHFIGGLIFPVTFKEEGGRENIHWELAADSALYNGIYLAGLVFEYAASGNIETLRQLARSADGIFKITHITGSPGFLCRYALPLEEAIRSDNIRTPAKNSGEFHIYYASASQVKPEYSYFSNLVVGQNTNAVERSPAALILDPTDKYYESTYFHTSTSRDQLTGIVFGLAVATYFLEAESLKKLADRTLSGEESNLITAIRSTIEKTSSDIYWNLRKNQWKLIDPISNAGGTANNVSELLKLSVEMLYRRTLMNATSSRRRELEMFLKDNPSGLPLHLAADSVLDLGFWDRMIWSHTWDYYEWNLRSLRLFTVVALDAPSASNVQKQNSGPIAWPQGPLTRGQIAKRNTRWMGIWNSRLWSQVGRHGNPWFTYLFNYANLLVEERSDSPGKPGRNLAQAHFFLKSQALAPIRMRPSACQDFPPNREKLCRIQVLDQPYAPHLWEFRNWLYERDLRKTPIRSEVSNPEVGTLESPMLELPSLFWLAVLSGQIREEFDGFQSAWFQAPLGSFFQ